MMLEPAATACKSSELFARVLLVEPCEQAADAGRSQLVPLDGGQERLSGQAGRQGRSDVQRHHRDQVVMLAVAARRTGAKVIAVAASAAATGEMLACRTVALCEFMHRRRDV